MSEEIRQPRVGDAVVFCDQKGVDYNAVLTAVWGETTPGNQPCVNLVFVSGDETRQDTYGRQIERSTSVYHAGNQDSLHGLYWRFPDEERNEYVAPFES